MLATDPVHDARQVGAFLALEPMAWCHAQGYRHYDLLASGSLDSLKAYKRSLGAEERPFEGVRLDSTLARAIGQAQALASALRRPVPA